MHKPTDKSWFLTLQHKGIHLRRSDTCETTPGYVLSYWIRLDEDGVALEIGLIFHQEVSLLNQFNYIIELRGSEGHVEDNIGLLVLSASSDRGCTAPVSVSRGYISCMIIHDFHPFMKGHVLLCCCSWTSLTFDWDGLIFIFTDSQGN